MEDWHQDLIEGFETILWRQWAALGAYITGEQCRRSVVDPEALVVGTFALGRNDARIFDEAMDWVARNDGLLKSWRLKTLSAEFGGKVVRTVGAALDYLSIHGGTDLFSGVKREAGKRLDEVKVGEEEELFWLHGRSSGRQTPDPVFKKWGFLRGKPRIRAHSLSPDFNSPANLMLRLRDYYGNATRADVMTFLLTTKGGSSNEIASKIKYDQAGVYRALEKFVRAGAVNKYGEAGKGHYWVDQPGIVQAFGLKEERPAFLVWGNIYRAFHLLVADWISDRSTYESEFLSAERLRGLTATVVPLLRNAGGSLSGLPAPDIRRQRGSEHSQRLIDYINRVIDVLLEHTAD